VFATMLVEFPSLAALIEVSKWRNPRLETRIARVAEVG
jgi:hypothetical protein